MRLRVADAAVLAVPLGAKPQPVAIAADPEKTRNYLLAVSMIASLKRAQELG